MTKMSYYDHVNITNPKADVKYGLREKGSGGEDVLEKRKLIIDNLTDNGQLIADN
jgi:hypothetical protein